MRTRGAGGPEATATALAPIKLGRADATLSIDPSKLEAPSSVYDADCGWIEHRPGQVSLFFAKKKRDQPQQLHSRIEIRYQPEMVVQTLWTNAEGYLSDLTNYVSSWSDDARRVDPPPTDWIADRRHS